MRRWRDGSFGWRRDAEGLGKNVGNVNFNDNGVCPMCLARERELAKRVKNLEARVERLTRLLKKEEGKG